MARSGTTYNKGQGGGKKGSKHASTKVKESIGVTNWMTLRDFLLSSGTAKFQEEIMKLKGHQFTSAYLAAIEYFKPKLQRTELVGDPEKPLQTQTIDLSKLSIDDLEKLTALIAKGSAAGTGETEVN